MDVLASCSRYINESAVASYPVNCEHFPVTLSSIMSETVIRKLNSAITIFSIPFSRMGLPIGNRSTGIKLKNNDVFVLVSSPPDEPTKEALNEMGRVA